MAPQNQAGPQPQFTEVKCSVELFNKLVSYIHGQPYSQVAALIEEIKNGFRPVMPAPAPAPVPAPAPNNKGKKRVINMVEKEEPAPPEAA